MQCHEFEERMQTLLDLRRPAENDPELLAHARICVDCRLDLRTQEALLRGLRNASLPALSGSLAERVVSHSAVAIAPRSSTRLRRPWFVASGLIAAAAAALLVVVMIQNQQRPTPSAPNGVVPSSLAVDRAADSATPPGRETSVSAVLPEADNRPPGTALADSQANPPGSEALQQYSEALQSLASQMPAVDQLDNVEEVTPGLRTVRNSFSLAIGTIRRTIPPPRKSSPPRKPVKGDSSWLADSADRFV